MGLGRKLNPTLRQFIARQPVFFVATAAREGRINISPKGMQTLQVVDDTRIIWLNLSGSGNETAAHVLSTGRMTLMFCAFEGAAMILRVYGSAQVLHPHHDAWKENAARFARMAGSRQIFDMTIGSVLTSCGTGVPLMQFVESRGEKQLLPYYEEMGERGVEDYWRRKNRVSIDGLPTGIFD